jgi:hypothetical protein
MQVIVTQGEEESMSLTGPPVLLESAERAPGACLDLKWISNIFHKIEEPENILDMTFQILSMTKNHPAQIKRYEKAIITPVRVGCGIGTCSLHSPHAL